MSDLLSERAKTLLASLDAMPDLNSEYLNDVRGLFSLAASDADAAEDRIAALEARANGSQPPMPRNVISFTRAKAVRIRSGELAARPPSDHAGPKSGAPILFWCGSRSRARIAALDAHNALDRWLFLSLEDIGRQALRSPEEWARLAGVTVYVDDLEALPTDEQIRLLERIGEASGADAPLVMARLTFADDDLAQRLLPCLLERFEAARLDEEASLGDLGRTARAVATRSLERPRS